MSEIVPDLTAYRLDEAISILRTMKVNYSLQKTAPPTGRGDSGRRLSPSFYRVLKQTEIGDNIIELVIAADCSVESRRSKV